MSKGKVLFQLSGSIACFKACQVISNLVQAGYEVEIVATPSALQFVGQATLEGLTGRRIHTGLFEPGEAMQHIHLIRWADLAILCPASANTINKLALGLGNDLISTLFLAHDFTKPYLIAPAMNTSMWRHPTTVESLERLRGWGVQILDPGSGELACGEVGEGRLMEPDLILASIVKCLDRPSNPLRVLVTAGGTREAIDDVRSITNFSTGRTGVALAEYFMQRGHEVTLLKARSAVKERGVRTNLFETFTELQIQLETALREHEFDTVIHAAAVSDYSVDYVEADGKRLAPGGKIGSDSAPTIHLTPNPKLLDSLRLLSKNPKIQVVAFKLTSGANLAEREEAVNQMWERAKPDVIVQNDLSEITDSRHPASIFDFKTQAKQIKVNTKHELAQALESLLLEGRCS